MLALSLTLRDTRWRSLLTKEEAFLRKLLRKAAAALNMPAGSYRVDIILTDDAEISALNKTWRGKNKPTNVLSFPFGDMRDGQVFMGDIVLAYETAMMEARLMKKTRRDHAAHLLLHGFLHLRGYDHMTLKQAREMESLEIVLLHSVGIKNPYR